MNAGQLSTSPFNLHYALSAARDLEPVMVPNRPDHYYLALGITNSCNFDCPFCYYHGTGPQAVRKQLSIHTMQKIFASLPKLAGVIFGLEGEPLLHENFLEFLELAGKHANAITLITNGSLITEKLCCTLARFRSGRIILSAEGSDAVAYERFRKHGSFERFKRNAALVAERLPCQLHATVFKENLSSLLGLPTLARDLGIRRISLQQVRPRPGYRMEGIQPASLGEIRAWLPGMLANAGENGVTVELDRNFGGSAFAATLGEIALPGASVTIAPMERGHCDHADRLACILSDGSLFPCAGDFEPIPLQEYSFDAIFNHPYLHALRSLHKAGRKIEPCRICMNDLLPGC